MWWLARFQNSCASSSATIPCPFLVADSSKLHCPQQGMPGKRKKPAPPVGTKKTKSDDVWIGDVNSKMTVSVQKAVALLKKTKIIGEAFEKKALTISEAGSMEGFTIAKWKKCLSKGCADEAKFTKVAGNILHLNPLRTSTPGVPWSTSQIKRICRDNFAKDRAPAAEAFPFETHTPAADQHFNIESQIGSLEQCSAEEPFIASLLSAEACVLELQVHDPKLVQKESVAALKSWVTMFQRGTFVIFKCDPGIERYWKAQRLRAKFAQDHEVLTRLLSQQS